MAPIEAKLVGIDRLTDLAVLKIDMTGLPALQLADSDELKQGQVVFAFGSPLGLENSVTMGVVSATARQIDPDNPAIYIQTDAPINPGNSGGPLVDVDGHVVGINTFILSQSGGNEGLGFAIPSDVVRSVYRPDPHRRPRASRTDRRLSAHHHARAGRGTAPSVRPWRAAGGCRPGSPAEKAGIKVGDIVISVGGKPVDDVRQFALDLYNYKIGQKADVGVLRDGKETTLQVTVIERADDPERFADMVTGPDNLVNRLGIVAVTINGELKESLAATCAFPAACWLPPRRPPATLLGEGPQPGDVIHAVNGAPIHDLTELKQHLRQIKPGRHDRAAGRTLGLLSYLVLESE